MSEPSRFELLSYTDLRWVTQLTFLHHVPNTRSPVLIPRQGTPEKNWHPFILSYFPQTNRCTIIILQALRAQTVTEFITRTQHLEFSNLSQNITLIPSISKVGGVACNIHHHNNYSFYTAISTASLTLPSILEFLTKIFFITCIAGPMKALFKLNLCNNGFINCTICNELSEK